MNVRAGIVSTVCAVITFLQAGTAMASADAPHATDLAPARSVAVPKPSAQPVTGQTGEGAVHGLDRADLEAWLDGLVPYALTSGDIAGAVVVVVKDGAVLLQKGYGFADVAKQVRMDPQRTMVRIGSTSKLFTWISVMQLVEQGKLELHHDVNDYLDFKISSDFGKPVTLRDLMNHRAGFEEGLKDVLRTDTRDLPSTESYLKEHQRPMLFAPGEVPAYSNYGAALAGYIVQRVSGEPFERYVEKNVLTPLGMLNTSFEQPLPERFADQVSKGYRSSDLPPGEYEQVITRPAGSGTATAADMAKFMIALLGGGSSAGQQLVQADTMQQILTPTEDTLPGFATMAHGFFKELHNGRVVYGHGGDTILFHTEFNFLPQEHVGVYYTFNSRGRDNSVYVARAQLFDGFMDRYFPDPQPAVNPPPLPTAVADAQTIAGRYESSRRIAHGFLSIFYVLQQANVAANADGTISVPRQAGPGMATYAEVGPQLWREMGGRGQVALTTVNGIKTIVDGTDPISVLQEAPFYRSAPLNLAIMSSASIVLMLTLLGWVVSPVLRPLRGVAQGSAGELRRLRLRMRIAAAYDFLYVVAWLFIMRPILGLEIGFYSSRLDPVIRLMQFAGLLAFAAAALGLWCAWRMCRLSVPLGLRLRTGIVAASLVGVVWIGIIGGLTRFSLNY